MRNRLWLLAGAALAILLLAATATATTKVCTKAPGASPAAAPFAQSWAQVPRTQAARKAKDILVFGQEQDIVGFNTNLTCCNQFWAGVQTVPVIRGAFITNNKLQNVKDLVTDAHGDENDALVHDPPRRELELGRQEGPGHVQGLRLHVAADRRSEERSRRP